MRTKALILTAAIGAAGLGATMAQDPVFSANAVGYINVDLPAGYALIANQLNNGGNTLNEVIPEGVASGTVFLQFNGTGFDQALFLEGIGWDNNLTLGPGEAGYIQSAADQSITFVGEVPQGELTVDLPTGLSMTSSMVPQEASLSDMGFPGSTGDTIFFYRDGNFEQTLYVEGVGFLPDAVPSVGEGFWVQKATEGTWTRTFSVND